MITCNVISELTLANSRLDLVESMHFHDIVQESSLNVSHNEVIIMEEVKKSTVSIISLIHLLLTITKSTDHAE